MLPNRIFFRTIFSTDITKEQVIIKDLSANEQFYTLSGLLFTLLYPTTLENETKVNNTTAMILPMSIFLFIFYSLIY